MIIKLDKGDEIEDIQYLEIDDPLLFDKSEREYENRSLYILHFPLGDEIRVSYGRGSTKENDYDIIHKCETNKGSSGSPIFNLSTNKIIGIHKSYVSKSGECFNLGTFLKYPLKEIKKLSHKNVNIVKRRESNLVFKNVEPKKIIENKINNSYLKENDLSKKYRKIDNKQILNIDNKNNNIYKKDEKKMKTNLDNFHKKVPNYNLEENNLGINYRKINNQQSLNIDNNLYIKDEKNTNFNLDNFQKKIIHNYNLGENKLKHNNYSKINSSQNLNFNNNIYKKEEVKMNNNPDNFQKNNSNSNISGKHTPTKYKKIGYHKNLRINNNIKNDDRIKKYKYNLNDKIRRKDSNNTELDNYNTSSYKINLNVSNKYQRYNTHNINNNTINNGEEEHNKNEHNINKMNAYINFKKAIINKINILDNSPVKNGYNQNQIPNTRYLNSNNKNYAYDTYRNIRNSYINYNNLNQNKQFQVSNSSINQIYRNNNQRNYKVNVSVERSQELFFGNEKTIENCISKYIPNQKLVSTPNLIRRDNSRKTKSLYSIKINGLFKK